MWCNEKVKKILDTVIVAKSWSIGLQGEGSGFHCSCHIVWWHVKHTNFKLTKSLDWLSSQLFRFLWFVQRIYLSLLINICKCASPTTDNWQLCASCCNFCHILSPDFPLSWLMQMWDSNERPRFVNMTGEMDPAYPFFGWITSLSIFHVRKHKAFWNMDASIVEDDVANFLADIPQHVVFS